MSKEDDSSAIQEGHGTSDNNTKANESNRRRRRNRTNHRSSHTVHFVYSFKLKIEKM